MDTHDVAYVAGIFDGEGSVTLARLEKKVWSKRVDFTLKIRISNTHRPLLEWIKSVFGGNVYINCRAHAQHKKPVYQWCLHNVLANKFLLLIRSRLKIKGPQADIADKFQATKEVVGQPRKYVRGTPLEITAIRRQLYKELISLNSSGRSRKPLPPE